MFLEKLLCVVGAVERLAIGIIAGTRVIAANNKMSDTMILAD